MSSSENKFFLKKLKKNSKNGAKMQKNSPGEGEPTQRGRVLDFCTVLCEMWRWGRLSPGGISYTFWNLRGQ